MKWAWLVIFIVTAIVLGFVLAGTIFGRQIYQLGTNEVAARHAGIRTRQIKLVLFLLVGAVSAIAGMMTASRLGSVRYDLGLGVEHGTDWAVAVLSASAARGDEHRLRETVRGTFTQAADGFTAEEFTRARRKIQYRFARLADSRLDRALAHASRASGGHPTLATSERMVATLRPGEVEAQWRSLLRAPTLTAILRA